MSPLFRSAGNIKNVYEMFPSALKITLLQVLDDPVEVSGALHYVILFSIVAQDGDQGDKLD